LSNQSRDEKIVAKYMLLYFYKIFRLIIIAVIITYFIGCFWWLLSTSLNSDDEDQTNFVKYFELTDKEERY
jgi:predicted permease